MQNHLIVMIHIFSQLLNPKVATTPAANHKIRSGGCSFHGDFVVEQVDALVDVRLESQMNRSSSATFTWIQKWPNVKFAKEKQNKNRFDWNGMIILFKEAIACYKVETGETTGTQQNGWIVRYSTRKMGKETFNWQVLAASNIWLKLWNPVVPYAVYSAVQLRERFIHANRWRRFEKWGAYTTFTFYLSYSFVFLFYSFPIVKGKNNELKFNGCPFQSKSKFDCVLICLQ